MFGVGTSVDLLKIRERLTDYRAVGIGLGFQMVLLPLFALVIAIVAPMSPEFKIGLFIVALCPGGTTSNFISYLLKLDTALSLSLTSINSILILFTIPFLSSWALQTFSALPTEISFSVLSTFWQVLLILIIPALVGATCRTRYPAYVEAFDSTLKIISSLLLAIVFAVKFLAPSESGGSEISQADIKSLLPFCLLLHLGSMVVSFLFSKKWLSQSAAATIGVEVGLQNTGLAILVTGTFIGSNEMTKPALVFAMFSFFTTLLFAWLARGYKTPSVNNLPLNTPL